MVGYVKLLAITSDGRTDKSGRRLDKKKREYKSFVAPFLRIGQHVIFKKED